MHIQRRGLVCHEVFNGQDHVGRVSRGELGVVGQVHLIKRVRHRVGTAGEAREHGGVPASVLQEQLLELVPAGL